VAHGTCNDNTTAWINPFIHNQDSWDPTQMLVLNGSLAQFSLACRDWVSLHAVLLECSTSAAASLQCTNACKTLQCGLPSLVSAIDTCSQCLSQRIQAHVASTLWLELDALHCW
jgi:hypothetical protein